MRRILTPLFLMMVCGGAHASDLENTLAGLAAIAPAKAQAALEARLESEREAGHDEALLLGKPLGLRFESDRAGYLTVLRLDSHGIATLLLPSAGSEAAIEADAERRIDAGTVRAPTGPTYLFTLLTERPIGRREFGYFAEGDDPSVIDAHDGAAFAQALRRAADSSGVLATALVEDRIRGTLDSETIVAYFSSPITRNLRRPSLDIYINFEFDSADIKPESIPMVDTLSDALRDEALESTHFVLGGHADDVGDDAYNLELSRRRAESVRDHLTANGVEPDRFRVEAYGESRPLQPGVDDEARALNRRVELILRR